MNDNYMLGPSFVFIESNVGWYTSDVNIQTSWSCDRISFLQSQSRVVQCSRLGNNVSCRCKHNQKC